MEWLVGTDVLMSDMRQTSFNFGAESLAASSDSERPALAEPLMEEVCKRDNLLKAVQRVKSNKGSAGIDGMSVDELPAYLKQHWPTIREQLLRGTYKPQPVRRVEIPKPGGGVRKLGIPTVLDRFIQQAVLQVLQPSWDPTFSPHSFGFRPNRSAHQAVAQAQKYVAAGYSYVVDIDLEKFFDTISHDKLMNLISKRVSDKRMLRLIRAFLTAGVLENGLVSPTDEGSPQGGPLSPLVSNLMLDELDRELERRGLRFTRFADDCNIYVKSKRAGGRVMNSLSRFITQKLKLKLNQAKSAVARAWERQFLGFSFTAGGRKTKRRIAAKALAKFRQRVRELTQRSRGVSMERVIEEVTRYMHGWIGYFGYSQQPSMLQDLDSWVKRRLRCLAWVQWKTRRRRYKELRRLGVSAFAAARTAASGLGPWRLSRTPALNFGLSNAYFSKLGLPALAWQMKA